MAPAPRTSITGNFHKLKDFIDTHRSFFLKLPGNSWVTTALFGYTEAIFSGGSGGVYRPTVPCCSRFDTNEQEGLLMHILRRDRRLIQSGRYSRSIEMRLLSVRISGKQAASDRISRKIRGSLGGAMWIHKPSEFRYS